ncbi:(2Fe-2S)-binding protein [Streptomonospora litoralis]|uniref:Ferric siderophore reductase C-terminal domain-containing protein n=1 Tax=Streptomonospora litoralis TaxID=2498135 RepID=A0A4V0ZJQ3_9ACTN|nr:(2Fe-2S)-binding protein [Streptomonospora litoralis]QBI54282.1 hypothetical protein EKD16_12495 [Streptomonospora litoralis]
MWRRGDLLAGEVAAVRARLAAVAGRPVADVEQRVAASVCYQGLASRLLSPAVAAALCHGVVAPVRALRWRVVQGRLRPALGAGAGAGAAVAAEGPRTEAAADAVAEHVLDGALAPLARAMRRQARLAPRLLYGNAASSLAGAVQALAAARPAHAADAWSLAQLLLERAPLRGLGAFAAAPTPETAAAAAFTRTTCCLYYRVPGQAMCGDCVIAARTQRA